MDYLDASHFFLFSLFIIALGVIFMFWNTQCKDKQLKPGAKKRLTMVGVAFITTGAVTALMTLWLFRATVYGTRRVKMTNLPRQRIGGYPTGNRGYYNDVL